MSHKFNCIANEILRDLNETGMISIDDRKVFLNLQFDVVCIDGTNEQIDSLIHNLLEGNIGRRVDDTSNTRKLQQVIQERLHFIHSIGNAAEIFIETS